MRNSDRITKLEQQVLQLSETLDRLEDGNLFTNPSPSSPNSGEAYSASNEGATSVLSRLYYQLGVHRATEATARITKLQRSNAAFIHVKKEAEERVNVYQKRLNEVGGKMEYAEAQVACLQGAMVVMQSMKNDYYALLTALGVKEQAAAITRVESFRAILDQEART